MVSLTYKEARIAWISSLKVIKAKGVTEQDWEDVNNATKCSLCANALQEDENKGWDHCHFSGNVEVLLTKRVTTI